MSKNGAPPPYGFVPPPSAPPSYAQAVGGVAPVSPFVPEQQTHIVTTVSGYLVIIFQQDPRI